MNISHIIFDWDGTLAKTLDLWLAGYRQAFERRSLFYDAKTIVAEFFHDHQSMPERHPDLEFTPIAEETREYVLNNSVNVQLYEDSVPTLDHLTEQGIDLTLVTSSSRQLLTNGLKNSPIKGVFSSIIAGDDGYGHKPDPLPFEETLERAGAKAEQTLIIGDSHVDIQAGKSIGCHTCLFAPQQNELFHDFTFLKSMNADFEIGRLQELPDCL